MILRDEQALAAARSRRCECCGRVVPGGCDPAHIFSRGAGEVSVAWNIVSLCRRCHGNSHGGHHPNRQALLDIAAEREKTTPEAIEVAVYCIRRLPKDTRPDQLEAALPALAHQLPAAWKLVKEALENHDRTRHHPARPA